MLAPDLEAMAPLSDEALVERINAGDAPVFELLMRRHNQRLFRLARSVVRNADEAEEVVQETYVRAFGNLRRFEGRSSVITWLSRIAFHEALRRNRRRRRARFAAGYDLDGIPMSEPASDASDAMIRHEASASLTAALDGLPTAYRAIVMLRLVEGLSTRETAHSLRLSESAVKVGLHRARRLLQEALERDAIPRLRHELSFASTRCDRIVANVFKRLAIEAGGELE